MATTPITITSSKESLKELFNQMKEVYYLATANQAPSSLATFDVEFPVLDDGVTFNTGDPSITKVKLTTGDTWTSVSEAGDNDISFQVASVHDTIASLLLDKKGAADQTVGTDKSINGKSYTVNGYSTAPKKVTGALFLCSEDRASCLYLPNIEGYSSFISEKGKPAYFSVKVSLLTDTAGASIYIGKSVASA